MGLRPDVRRTTKQSKWASRRLSYIYEKNLCNKPEVSNLRFHFLESEVRSLTTRPRFVSPFVSEPQPRLAIDGYIEIAHYRGTPTEEDILPPREG